VIADGKAEFSRSGKERSGRMLSRRTARCQEKHATWQVSQSEPKHPQSPRILDSVPYLERLNEPGRPN
jgi:hypothetical protein